MQHSTCVGKWRDCMTFLWFGQVSVKVQLCHDKEQSLISLQNSINNGEAFTGKCGVLHLIISIIMDVFKVFYILYLYKPCVWYIFLPPPPPRRTESVSYDVINSYLNSIRQCLTARFHWYSETTCFTYFKDFIKCSVVLIIILGHLRL